MTAAIRRRLGGGMLALGLALLLAVPLPAGADNDDEEPTEPTTRLRVGLDIHGEVPRTSWSARGPVLSTVHGRDRGGQSATSDEVGADAATAAERSLEELGAERTPEGLVVTLPETILFEFDSAELLGAADETIDRVADLLAYYADVDVEVQGHTDDHGEPGYNQELSEDRAEAVRDALVSAGASAAQLTTVGFGETQPVAPNQTDDGEDDPEGREQNRRVEIVLRDE
jgi:outer membrane protein OmpA-like peptidoglycan-associated protein